MPSYPTMWLTRLALTADYLDRFIIQCQISNRLQQVAFDDVRIRSAARAWGDMREDAYRAIRGLHRDLGFNNEDTYGNWQTVPILRVDSQGFRRNNPDGNVPGGGAESADVIHISGFDA